MLSGRRVISSRSNKATRSNAICPPEPATEAAGAGGKEMQLMQRRRWWQTSAHFQQLELAGRGRDGQTERSGRTEEWTDATLNVGIDR